MSRAQPVQRVTMTHPQLPDRLIHVRPAAVGAYTQAGWELVAPEQATDEKAEPVAEAGPQQEKPTRRRRVTNEEADRGADAA